MKETLGKFRKFFFAQKYRFDQGLQFMVFLNFSLLVITASDKLKNYTHLDNTRSLLVIFIPAAFVGMWFIGFILDKYVKSQKMQEIESTSRSPTWQKIYTQLDNIQSEVKQMREEINNLKKNG